MSKELSKSPLVHTPVQVANVHLGPFTEVGEMSYLENVDMDAYSYCGPFCIFQNAKIGKFASIAASVRIGPTRHPIERPTLHHFTYRRRLYGFAERDDEDFFSWRANQIARVGHDTWIGHGAIVMPNVTIGNGSVIGAGAVVTRDVPPYSVAVGSPARVIRSRFEPGIAEAMERIAWWEWTREEIAERLDAFTGSVAEFVAAYDVEPAPTSVTVVAGQETCR
jgi:phosphonate metabolism protein (transferase hexapeptide repeat family)